MLGRVYISLKISSKMGYYGAKHAGKLLLFLSFFFYMLGCYYYMYMLGCYHDLYITAACSTSFGQDILPSRFPFILQNTLINLMLGTPQKYP